MSAVFLKILNMSITASWLILAVVFARLLLKKAPKWIACLLWALVAIRLVCPFSIKSVISLIPSGETIPENIEILQNPEIDTGIAAINDAVNPVIVDSFAPDPFSSVNPLQIVIPVAAAVWVAGIAALLIYALISYLKLKKTVSASVPVGDRIMACDEVNAPFILGLLRPVIYVPSSMGGQTLKNVLRHEAAHIKRRDYLWKPLGYLLLSVNWFNPLCWIAYILLCRDIEMACDERVVRDMDREEMAAYSQALLDCSIPRKRLAACPLAFGEVGVKARVKGVLNYKKPAFWIVLAAIIVCVGLAVFLMTDPASSDVGAPEGHWVGRPSLVLNGTHYINPYKPESSLPHGYYYAGVLTPEQANGTGIEGTEYFINPDEPDDFYTYQYTGTPFSIDEVDSEHRTWQYIRWISEELETMKSKRLTLDDVRWLSKKGDELSRTDFDRYICEESRTIARYPIDTIFDFVIEAASINEEPEHFYLRNRENGDTVDIRNEDVEAFIKAYS
ncbi:MAG: hypothetical protein II668_00020 [Oscillospiraceae bacterium]|nr:hypothetical protein [Oscillospiraceae bacterium]